MYVQPISGDRRQRLLNRSQLPSRQHSTDKVVNLLDKAKQVVLTGVKQDRVSNLIAYYRRRDQVLHSRNLAVGQYLLWLD